MSQNLPLPVDVISIQSQVVYGCVGNSAAVPTLEHYNLTVSSVPTVLLSNRPHYPTMYGGVIDDQWFAGFLTALKERDVLKSARAIILGYLGSPKQADILANFLTEVRRDYPHILIQIDPVLGDVGCGLYVDPNLAKVYREKLRHLATGMTPNHFELEYLADCKINSLEESIAAAKNLLSDTTCWIIATSAAPQTWANGEMKYVIVTADKTIVKTHAFHDVEAYGTGDTFAASLVAHLLKGHSLEKAAEAAVERVMTVIQRTGAAKTNEIILFDKDHQ